MTKLISLKLDEKLLQEVQKLADAAGTSRNQYINEAVAMFVRERQKEQIRKEVHRASLAVREESMRVLHDFEALEDDYESLL